MNLAGRGGNMMTKTKRASDRNSSATDGPISREALSLVSSYEPPAAGLETTVAESFAYILDVQPIGADDDFFDLGGDSLLAEALSLELQRATGREFKVASVIDYGTPRKIAALLSGMPAGAGSEQTNATRPPIFLVHGRLGFTLPRPEFMAGLSAGQELHCFELRGIRGNAAARHHIKEIAADYVAELEARFPRGPILLASFCRGGVIGLEMTGQLAEKGRTVRQLVLFDPSVAPNVDRNFRRNAGVDAVTRIQDHLWHLLLRGRWTDGSRDADIGDEKLRALYEKRMRIRLWRERNRPRRQRFPPQTSRTAQAKLLAAYCCHRPRVFRGPAAIIASVDRQESFHDPAGIWAHLLPNRQVYVAGETHSDILRAGTSKPAALMQSIFDQAMAAPEMQQAV